MKQLLTVAIMTLLFALLSDRQEINARLTREASQPVAEARDLATTFNQDGGGFGFALVASRAAPEVRVRMLLTALAFDRSLKGRAGHTVQIGTVGACPTAAALHRAQGAGRHGLQIQLHTAPPAGTAAGLGAWVKERGIKVLYLCEIPAEAHTLAGILEADSVTTLADEPTWVGSFASMGVAQKDGHPRLVVNLENVRAAGMSFDSSIYASSILIAN